MAGDRALTPDDAAVAVRSFPRRFRATFARPVDDEDRFDPDEIARRPGPDGATAADHLLAALAIIEAIPDAAGTPQHDDGAPISELLERLQAAADAAAQRIDRVPNDQWGDRLATTQDAVADVASRLRTSADVLEYVRR